MDNISNLQLLLSGDACFSYNYEGRSHIVLFDVFSLLWQYASEEDIESGHLQVQGHNIVGFFTVSSGQGGIVFVWDVKHERLIHLSDCAFVIAVCLSGKTLFSLHDVQHWGVNAHFQLYKIPFGVIDSRKSGERVELNTIIDNKLFDGNIDTVHLVRRGISIYAIVSGKSFFVCPIDLDESACYIIRWTNPKSGIIEETKHLEIGDIIAYFQDSFADEICDALDSYTPKACGYFPNPCSMEDDIYSSATAYLQKITVEYAIEIEHESSEPDEIISPIILFQSILQNKLADSISYAGVVGNKITEALSKFIEEGKWQWGYNDGKKSNPIIWFGIKNEKPIEYWTISKEPKRFQKMPYTKGYDIEAWKSCFFNRFWAFDWNLLLNNSNEYLITNMFAEHGLDEPDITSVIGSCPIKITEKDAVDELKAKIDELFAKTAKNMKWSVSYLKTDYCRPGNNPITDRTNFFDEFTDFYVFKGTSPQAVITESMQCISEIMRCNSMDVHEYDTRIEVFAQSNGEIATVYEDFFSVYKTEA